MGRNGKRLTLPFDLRLGSPVPVGEPKRETEDDSLLGYFASRRTTGPVTEIRLPPVSDPLQSVRKLCSLLTALQKTVACVCDWPGSMLIEKFPTVLNSPPFRKFFRSVSVIRVPPVFRRT